MRSSAEFCPSGLRRLFMISRVRPELRSITWWAVAWGVALVVAAPLGIGAQSNGATPAASSNDVTFSKDIAPILPRSCQGCHQPAGIAPMPLITYEQVRPYARAIKTRTALGRTGRTGAMPPWYVDKTIGIQHYEGDTSLTLEEIDKVAKWADSGALQG